MGASDRKLSKNEVEAAEERDAVWTASVGTPKNKKHSNNTKNVGAPRPVLCGNRRNIVWVFGVDQMITRTVEIVVVGKGLSWAAGGTSEGRNNSSPRPDLLNYYGGLRRIEKYEKENDRKKNQ